MKGVRNHERLLRLSLVQTYKARPFIYLEEMKEQRTVPTELHNTLEVRWNPVLWPGRNESSVDQLKGVQWATRQILTLDTIA